MRSLVVDLTEKLDNVPSQQSTDFVYIGMIRRADIYAPIGTDTWEEYSDPVPYRASIGGTMSAIDQHDTTYTYNANKLIFDS